MSRKRSSSPPSPVPSPSTKSSRACCSSREKWLVEPVSWRCFSACSIRERGMQKSIAARAIAVPSNSTAGVPFASVARKWVRMVAIDPSSRTGVSYAFSKCRNSLGSPRTRLPNISAKDSPITPVSVMYTLHYSVAVLARGIYRLVSLVCDEPVVEGGAGRLAAKNRSWVVGRPTCWWPTKPAVGRNSAVPTVAPHCRAQVHFRVKESAAAYYCAHTLRVRPSHELSFRPTSSRPTMRDSRYDFMLVRLAPLVGATTEARRFSRGRDCTLTYCGLRCATFPAAADRL